MNRSLDGWRSDGSFDVGKREKDLFRKKQIGTRRTPLLFIAWCIYNYLPMKLLEVVFFFLFLHSTTVAFVPPSNKTERSVVMSADGNIQQSETPCMGQHPFNSLPGDPSLNLVTNVDLGDKKMEIMKGKPNKLVTFI